MNPREQPAYLDLRSIVSERTRPVLVWVGSGLSASVGVPTWADLKSRLVDALRAKASTLAPSDARELADCADAIARSSDYWSDFERLRNELGQTTYAAAIRTAIQPAATANVPATYSSLWRLPVAGLLTLNIDRLAARAFSQNWTGRGAMPVERSGPEISKLHYLLQGRTPFIANLHGSVEDVASWVFTSSELRALEADPTYAMFLRACLSQFTNVFVAINPDDRAIERHLKWLKDGSIEGAPNFWITDRRDIETDKWAESVGIRVVRYDSHGGANHSDLEVLLDDLASHVAQEPPAAPPVAAHTLVGRDKHATAGLDANTLASSSTDAIRFALNEHATRILADGDAGAYRAYEEFSRNYDELIYRAWYTTTAPGANKILGIELVEDVARGAFGRVYRAIDADGNQVAVKVLLDEVRRDRQLLESFRRGVRAMSILNDRKLDGMVSYKAASEIPAFVVMDWVEGPNLQQAREASAITEWHDILHVIERVSTIIEGAHRLPERVLHRDIRPANIMLRNYWTEPSSYDVVVLDFDLSWHRGAAERSIVHTSASGYLAPEQVLSRTKESTRNSAVDSFGIGMTLYYLVAGRDPVPSQHLHRDWNGAVSSAAELVGGTQAWRSTPRRVTRLILGATADRQADRMDIPQIRSEVNRLKAALGHGSSDHPPMIAEELAARVPSMRLYQWSEDEQSATTMSASGVRSSLANPLATEIIRVEFSWARLGHEQRTGLTKYVQGKADAIESRLRRRWRMRRATVTGEQFDFMAEAPSRDVMRDIDGFAGDLEWIHGQTDFSGH